MSKRKRKISLLLSRQSVSTDTDLPAFQKASDLIDRCIHFYNHERIQLKTGVAPLTLRHSAKT